MVGNCSHLVSVTVKKSLVVFLLWTWVFEWSSFKLPTSAAVISSRDDPVRTYVEIASFDRIYSGFTVNSTTQIMFVYNYTMDNQVRFVFTFKITSLNLK